MDPEHPFPTTKKEMQCSISFFYSRRLNQDERDFKRIFMIISYILDISIIENKKNHHENPFKITFILVKKRPRAIRSQEIQL